MQQIMLPKITPFKSRSQDTIFIVCVFSPVLMAAMAAKKAMAYIMLFLRSNRPGRRIHAVHG